MSQRLASSRLVSLALRNATRRERISPCRRPALLHRRRAVASALDAPAFLF